MIVLDPGSRRVVAAATVSQDGGRQIMFNQARAADLDGDGTDEVMFTGAFSISGAADSWLEVWRVDGAKVVATGKGNIPLESTGYDVKDCKATYAIEGRELVVTRTLVAAEHPGPGEQKVVCEVGTHRLRLEGGVLK
jgi:hypothetical protein